MTFIWDCKSSTLIIIGSRQLDILFSMMTISSDNSSYSLIIFIYVINEEINVNFIRFSGFLFLTMCLFVFLILKQFAGLINIFHEVFCRQVSWTYLILYINDISTRIINISSRSLGCRKLAFIPNLHCLIGSLIDCRLTSNGTMDGWFYRLKAKGEKMNKIWTFYIETYH